MARQLVEERLTRGRSMSGGEDGGCLINNKLPEQILECIFQRLEVSDDRGAASEVCKMWQHVDGLTRKMVYITNCYSIAPQDLSRRFKNLVKIKIKGKPRAYEFGLLVKDWGGHVGPWIEEIVRAYPKLKVLHLRRMDVRDEDLALLASKCTELQKLKLQKCSGFSTIGLESITKSCRCLRILDLEESDEMDDKKGPWLQNLQEGEGTLAGMNFASAGLDETNVKESLDKLGPTRLKAMRSLRVSDMDLDSFFNILDYSVVPVVELGLGCYSSRPVEPKDLASSYAHRLSRVTTLDLKYATLSAEIQIELLRHCCSLQELELRSAVGDRGMEVIGDSCKQLKRIRVDHIHSDGSSDYVTQKGMMAICEGCRELDFLVMYLSDVNNEALAAVGRCLPKLTDFRIVLLQVLAVVEDLPLDEGVRSLLQGCPLLTRFSVYLRAGGLSDRGVGYIGEFGAKLKWVLLGCSGASDHGLRLMAEGCRDLERLELRGCPFSADQLATSILQKWTRLKYLWLQGIGATYGLGAALVNHKKGFLIEYIEETTQILGYYTVAQPRTDNPPSVQIIYPGDSSSSSRGQELPYESQVDTPRDLTAQEMLAQMMRQRDPRLDYDDDHGTGPGQYFTEYPGDLPFYPRYHDLDVEDEGLDGGYFPHNGMYFEDTGSSYGPDVGEDGASSYIYN